MKLWKCNNNCGVSSESKGSKCICGALRDTFDGDYELRRSCGGGMNYYNVNTPRRATPGCGCLACEEAWDAEDTAADKRALAVAKSKGVRF